MREFLIIHSNGNVMFSKALSQETLNDFRGRDVSKVINLCNRTQLVLRDGVFTWLTVN